jgi:ABC-type uncharacterized transport system substrate-binding protein
MPIAAIEEPHSCSTSLAQPLALLRTEELRSSRTRVFEQSLHALGWTVGQDLKIDYRMAGGAADRIRQYAAELVALAPDVIMPVGSATVAPVQQAAPTIPIVMVRVKNRQTCRCRRRPSMNSLST